MDLINRYRNITILVAVLFAQVLGLAMQVKRSNEEQSSRLIRIWAVNAVTPLEKAIVWAQTSTSNLWRNYLYLRGVRQDNRDLKKEIQRLRIEQVRLNEDAEQARRLQALLGFKEQFISQTMAAQVIGSSGSELSRSVYIDKGARDGIKPDMAVITSDGVVGKVLRVFGSKPLEASVSEVLLINDQSSGVGVILEKSRTQGVLRGTIAGEVIMEKVLGDEDVQPGEKVVTSGGDQIFLKGLPAGTVTKVAKGSEAFLNIWVKPAVNLSRLEEVLVVTKKEERVPSVAENGPIRAVDILSQRLPSVPKPADGVGPPGTQVNAAPGAAPGTTSSQPNAAPVANSKATAPKPTEPKPGDNTAAATGKPATAPAAKPDGGPIVKTVNGTKPGPTAKPVAPEPKPNLAPPQTKPAANQPPTTQPPATQPPATQPPATQPPPSEDKPQ
jgi:rod shape-determining protein MreC